MPRFRICIELNIRADSEEDARVIAIDGFHHLAETFNDDGSIHPCGRALVNARAVEVETLRTLASGATAGAEREERDALTSETCNGGKADARKEWARARSFRRAAGRVLRLTDPKARAKPAARTPALQGIATADRVASILGA